MYRRAGWCIGDEWPGAMVKHWPLQSRGEAEELTEVIGGLTDWTKRLIGRRRLEQLDDDVRIVELAFLSGIRSGISPTPE